MIEDAVIDWLAENDKSVDGTEVATMADDGEEDDE